MLLKILTCYVLICITHWTRAECPKFHMLVELERMTPPESDWDGFIVPKSISNMTWDYPMNTTEDYKMIKENNCILQIDYSNVVATCKSTKKVVNKSKHIFVPNDESNATIERGVINTISKDATTSESPTTLSTTIPLDSITTAKNVNESNAAFKSEKYVQENATATTLRSDSIVNSTLESPTTPSDPSTLFNETGTLSTTTSTTEDTTLEESTVGVSINTLVYANKTTLEDITDKTEMPTTEATTSTADEPTTVENNDLKNSTLKNSKDEKIGYVKAAAIFAGSVAGGAALIYLTTKAVTLLQSGAYRFPDPSSTPFLADTQV